MAAACSSGWASLPRLTKCGPRAEGPCAPCSASTAMPVLVPPGGDGVRADALLPVHHREGLRQPRHPVLRGGVGGTGRAAAQGRLGGGADDRAPADGQHVRQHRPGEQERRGEVDPDDPLPLRVADVREHRHAVHDPVVVHQHVHPAEALHRRPRHLVDDRLLTEVAGDGDGGAARTRYLLDGRLRALGVEVRHHDPGAFGGEGQGDGAPERIPRDRFPIPGTGGPDGRSPWTHGPTTAD